MSTTTAVSNPVSHHPDSSDVPAMGTQKSLGNWLMKTLLSRENIRQCFLLEWTANRLEELKSCEPQFRSERLNEVRASLGEVLGSLCTQTDFSTPELLLKTLNEGTIIEYGEGNRGLITELLDHRFDTVYSARVNHSSVQVNPSKAMSKVLSAYSEAEALAKERDRLGTLSVFEFSVEVMERNVCDAYRILHPGLGYKPQSEILRAMRDEVQDIIPPSVERAILDAEERSLAENLQT